MWKTVVGYLPAWLLVPWSMVSLWNERWSAMSFGSERFRSDAKARPIFKRFLLFYLAPVLLLLVGIATASMVGGLFMGLGVQSSFPLPLQILSLVVIVLGVYLLLGLIALSYYAAFLREAIGSLSLSDVRFRFEATTSDWINLFLGDIVLVVLTFGIGSLFLSYRHWKFFITHLDGDGVIDPAALSQSTTQAPRQGEGLLDAFDVGAF